MPTVFLRKARRAIMLLLLVPIVLAASVCFEIREYRNSFDWVIHTRRVMEVLDGILVTTLHADDQEQLSVLRKATPEFGWFEEDRKCAQAESQRVLRMTRDNPWGQQNGKLLADRLDRRFRLMKETLAQLGAHQYAEAVSMTSGENELTKQIMAQVRTMNQREVSLLEGREKWMAQTEKGVLLSVLLSVLASFGLLFGALHNIRAAGHKRDLLEQDLRDANQHLENRVNSRTADLASANEQLIKSNQDLVTFAYIASHDLQEPLRTISTYASLIAKRYKDHLDPDIHDYITLMVNGCRRMTTLVHDLLLYSQVGTRAKINDPVDLKGVVKTVRESLAAIITEHHATVIFDGLPTLRVDETMFGQVFSNLINNAIKFRKRDVAPLIEIKAVQEGGCWLFTVQDNGIGFEPKFADRIFGIFSRLHGINEYAGSGMGLAIVRRVIEMHGGRIWADSVEGVGSTFSFTLPADPQVAGESRPIMEKVGQGSQN